MIVVAEKELALLKGQIQLEEGVPGTGATVGGAAPVKAVRIGSVDDVAVEDEEDEGDE